MLASTAVSLKKHDSTVAMFVAVISSVSLLTSNTQLGVKEVMVEDGWTKRGRKLLPTTVVNDVEDDAVVVAFAV